MAKTEIIFGVHSVFEALRSGKRRIFEIYITGDRNAKRLLPVMGLAEDKSVPVHKLSPDKIKALAKTDNHQNIAATADPFAYGELRTRFDQTGLSASPFILMLDHILDPQNLGALLRTALCAGVDQVVIPKDRSAGATPAVSRASAGALEHIHLSPVTNLVATIKELKQEGFWVMGLDRDGRNMIYGMDFTGPLCIVIGGEDQGVSTLVKKHCDALVSIPQVGGFNSLNASAAGAVVLYEALRQRHYKGEKHGS